MVKNNRANVADEGDLKQMIFETCLHEGVDDLTATTIASILYAELQDFNMGKFTNLLHYKRARAFDEPDVSKEMAEFGKAVSKIIVEEIIMNDHIRVIK